MKLFKKLMAGAMAIAMLSVYTVAFATGTVSGSINSGSAASTATVSGMGVYAGDSAPVFLMKLPTAAAANAALTFTIDPQKTIGESKPANASGDSTYGSVIFSTVSGSEVTYKDESAPLKVVSMSSVDVKVNMFASLSNTKMTLSTTSGFTADSTEHLYLAVKVATISGGTPELKETKAIDGLGAKNATTLPWVPSNFKSVISGGVTTTVVSGASVGATPAATTANNLTAANGLDEDTWSAVQYTVVGASNGNGKADWKINGLNAPNLTITWKIDPASEITYAIDDPPANNNYKAQLDKNDYKESETVTLYVKPTSDEAKLTSARLNYIAVNAEGKMSEEKSVPFTVASTAVNGVYSATVALPGSMARPTSPKGDINAYKAPTWEIEVG